MTTAPLQREISAMEQVIGSQQLAAAAEQLWQARQSRQAIGPLREYLSPLDLVNAYAVQERNLQRARQAGAQRIGRKIGLTAQAVQKQLGVDQPDFGTLFNDMLYQGPRAVVPVGRFLQPRIEGEIAMQIAADIDQPGLSRAHLAQRIAGVMPAFEIVDSAIADWKITLADTVADNASCGAIVSAAELRPLPALNVRMAGMVLSADGVPVSLGVGAASLGDPLNALAWLADKALQLGDPLRAGEIILTGALGPMVPFERGKRYVLEIADFAPLEVLGE